uniref:Uncharacterized protein n=1 Tax=Chromera velia CCMP2878 TaxID=1169474 RepID=A0A0G4HG47_9ALVE|eukprot:Cvel_6730.t1-p1 / transcript=Cvel_6730.t1 / gene=Cvel_6730 / organism=Chromera_velia_CCMP2878 / gene_product=Ankyrin-3, putative / transcript_product=Ankyrin-3, putative / location=Cvel_scaffold336:76518-79116(+) / protein_length=249 / sequence_SO=supercontig / SO=protein_coding / is_pseudo=false
MACFLPCLASFLRSRRRRSTDPSSDVPKFQLTPIILRNVRKFRPVSADVFCEALKAFMDDNEDDDAADSLLLYVRLGADVNTLVPTLAEPTDPQTSASEAALHLVARKGSLAALRKLLDFGVYIEKRDSERRTPLLVACTFGHAAIVEALLSAGADPRCDADRDRHTPLTISAQKGHERKGNQQSKVEQENALRREMKTRAAASSSSSSSSVGPAVAAGVRTVPSPVAGRHSGGGKAPESVPEERLSCI